MVVPQQAQPVDTDYRRFSPFANIAALEPNGPAAAHKLQNVHRELGSAGALGDAQYLLSLDQAAERRDFVALERMTSVEHPLDELTELRQRRIRRVAGVRNAIAILPLLVTWALLGWASFDYSRQVATDDTLETRSFLVLWEGRFGGEFIPKFSETALVSFVLLTLVLLLTIVAHHLESRANAYISDIRTELGAAMHALALAAETSTIRPPMTAAEWAKAAQDVLEKTQRLILTAAYDVQTMADANRQLLQETRTTSQQLYTLSRQALADLQQRGQDFVGGLAAETIGAMKAVRAENSAFVADATKSAQQVLQQAGHANQVLIEQQMKPLFDGFRTALGDYRSDQAAYSASAAKMANGVTELTRAAQTLGSSAGTYAATAKSIDDHLKQIEDSQTAFVDSISDNSRSMTAAATAMGTVTGELSGRMRKDLEALATNVTAASRELAMVERQLGATGVSLGGTTATLDSTTAMLAHTATTLDDATRAITQAASDFQAIAKRFSAPRPPAPRKRRLWPWK